MMSMTQNTSATNQSIKQVWQSVNNVYLQVLGTARLILYFSVYGKLRIIKSQVDEGVTERVDPIALCGHVCGHHQGARSLSVKAEK